MVKAMTDLEKLLNLAAEFKFDMTVEEHPRYCICHIFVEDESVSYYFRNRDGKVFRRIGCLP